MRVFVREGERERKATIFFNRGCPKTVEKLFSKSKCFSLRSDFMSGWNEFHELSDDQRYFHTKVKQSKVTIDQGNMVHFKQVFLMTSSHSASKYRQRLIKTISDMKHIVNFLNFLNFP